MSWHAGNVNPDDHGDWQPGEQNPYANRGSHSNYLFNFRADASSEECGCADSATWPVEKRTHRLLADRDELGEFIAEWRRWKSGEAAEACRNGARSAEQGEVAPEGHPAPSEAYNGVIRSRGVA